MSEYKKKRLDETNSKTISNVAEAILGDQSKDTDPIEIITDKI